MAEIFTFFLFGLYTLICEVELPIVVKTVSNWSVSVEKSSFRPVSAEMLSSTHDGIVRAAAIPRSAIMRM
jgi:hypothetical protein